MVDYSEFYKARKLLNEILEKDLVGPIQKKEILMENPTQYYIMGKLYPQGMGKTAISNSADVDDISQNPLLDDPFADGGYDAAVSGSNQMLPSALGVSFILQKSVRQLQVKFTYAFYESETSEVGKITWKRKALDNTVTVSLADAGRDVFADDKISIQLYKNDEFAGGERMYTVTMVNKRKVVRDYQKNTEQILFQTGVQINLDMPGFTSIALNDGCLTNEEQLELEMLYKDNICYAHGHGCSVKWDIESQSPYWVASTVMPFTEVCQMEARSGNSDVFNMRRLVGGDDKVILDLRSFISLYEAWIAEQQDKLAAYPEKFHQPGRDNLSKCRSALRRIVRTLDALEASRKEKGQVWQAFCLANEAMLWQRKQSEIKRNRQPDESEIAWRPFQLAFILSEIYSFINPEDESREVVDLLWFPTGGGKTEAYLGIAAFAIFLRRLRDPQSDGVTVIMRYTLRLLTLQQFERASTLIVACELLRRRHKLGGSEISIGLWVGDSLTPNHLSDAKKQYIDTDNVELPVRACPWCGKPLTHADYSMDRQNTRLIIRCPHHDCAASGLSDGLPLHIVDDAVYTYLPTFIIATIDKFAQLPLQASPHVLFGRHTSGGDKEPPELIIQDELHLISGPLGTIAGLYEMTIGEMCRNKLGIPAKVIASTATVRNAAEQIKALYGRSFTQFPPQGITADDSFFAVVASRDSKPSRMYCGVMGVGTTQTTTFIRVNAALLFASRYLAEQGFSDEVVDNYWTLTDYFNTLRELGGAATQVLDDVQSRYAYLRESKFAGVYQLTDSGKYDSMAEITSRLNSGQIGASLAGMERRYDKKHPFDAYTFVLASNMISVGVDVGRLGTMIVSGQPKTNAEYIQATSRVGRANPGEVVVIYNSARSRDRSHYEQFLTYHTSLYKYVEASSLTPFSDRARDRALHALLITLCRHYISELYDDRAAKNIVSKSLQPKVMAIKQKIIDYIATVDKSEADVAARELDDILDAWKAEAGDELKYRYGGGKKLLQTDTELDSKFRTMNSMRNVEPQSGIYLGEGDY